MRPRLDPIVLSFACLVTACGGRSSLGDFSATAEVGGALYRTSNGGTWASTGPGTLLTTGGAKSAQGGFIATGGTRATGGSTAGLGGTTPTGTTRVGTGSSPSATGGVTHATGGANHGQGGTKATGGTTFGQGGMSIGSSGSGNQGGVSASGSTNVAAGGTTATGGVTGTVASAGGTAGSNTVGECGVDQVLCGTGTAARCADTWSDPEHCGQCGHACAKGAGCSSGVCKLARCQPTFRLGGKPTVETARTATALAVGDLNGDGQLDFATANGSANTVSVLLGDGKGAFGQRMEYPTDKVPLGIAIGDFNHDNQLDLVTANLSANSVSVLLGKGNGTFESAVQYPVGDGPEAVTIDDFDGDGSQDIATANWYADSVSILLGSDQGTFASKVDYSAGTKPNAIAVGDFNADGKKDLITNGDPFAVVLLGAGNGTFTEAPIASPDAGGGWLSDFALGDLNSDGKQDLIAASPNTRHAQGTFGVLFGVGDGSFLPMLEYDPGWASVVASADLDRDGKLELVTSVGGQSVSVLSLNADGSLAGAVSYPTPAPPEQVAIGDFNGDHWLDIAILNRWGKNRGRQRCPPRRDTTTSGIRPKFKNALSVGLRALMAR